MALSPYKLNQGVYARAVAGMAILVLALFASVRLFELLGGSDQSPMAVGIPVAYFWALALFVVLAAVVSVFTFGLHTGVRGLDSTSMALVDLLIDTQTELQKVSWPTREELRSSTTVVLICMAVLSVLLYAVDLVVSFVMSTFGVLPK
jgi:preprotein translocase SecE subunit